MSSLVETEMKPPEVSAGPCLRATVRLPVDQTQRRNTDKLPERTRARHATRRRARARPRLTVARRLAKWARVYDSFAGRAAVAWREGGVRRRCVQTLGLDERQPPGARQPMPVSLLHRRKA